MNRIPGTARAPASLALALALAFAPARPASAQEAVPPVAEAEIPSLPAPSLPPPSVGPPRAASSSRDVAQARLSDVIRGCVARRDAADRLKCFDRLGVAASELAAAPASARPGLWHPEFYPDGSVAAGLGAVGVSSNDDAWQKAPAGLFVRCRKFPDQEVDLYIGLGTRVSRGGGLVDVTFRLGDAELPREPWTPSVAGTALGLWGTERAGGILRRMETERRVSARLELPDDKFVILSFDLYGMAQALAPVHAACTKPW